MDLEKHKHSNSNHALSGKDNGRDLTRLCRRNGCGSLWDGYGLCWNRRNNADAVLGILMYRNGRWETLFCEVCSHNWGGFVQGHSSTAAFVAALYGDGFGHVHAKQGAEGLGLRGAHAEDGSGLDTISTGC